MLYEDSLTASAVAEVRSCCLVVLHYVQAPCLKAQCTLKIAINGLGCVLLSPDLC